MRKREPVESELRTVMVPMVLRLGPCIEVWSPSEKLDRIAAERRYSQARLLFEGRNALGTVESMRSIGPDAGPWTLGDEVAARRHGVHPSDVATLRAEAERLSR